MKQYKLAVSGLSCTNCANKVQKALEEMEGVAEVAVIFSSSKVYLTLEDDNSDLSIYKDKVKSLGYTLSDSEDEFANSYSIKHYPYTKTAILSGVLLLSGFIIMIKSHTYANYAFLLSMIFASYYVFFGFLKNMKNKTYFGMHTLIMMAVFGATILGQYMEGAMVVFLYNVGQVVEFLASAKSKKTLARLLTLTPEISYKIVDGKSVAIASNEVQVGDLLELRVGARLAVDGTVVSAGEVDESAITGESLPVFKNVGDSLLAGVLAVGAPLKVEATTTTENNSLIRINSLVDKANAHKSPISRQIEVFASRYTPFVVALAFIVGLVVPLVLGLNFADESGQLWIFRGLVILLLGCPCALVLAPPTAVASALSVAAKEGVLIKSGRTLEGLSKIKNIAFDKTGTLTNGKPIVTSVVALQGYSEQEVLHYAIQIEQSNNHPIAKAIANYAPKEEFLQVADIKYISGVGVEGYLGDDKVAVFSKDYAMKVDKNFSLDDDIVGTFAVILKNDSVIGYIVLQDELREESVKAIGYLNKMALNMFMLTGDNEKVAAHIVKKLNINYFAKASPEQKLQKIKEVSNNGRVAMVGDGINDAPALMAADIGIAMGSGSDIALDSADVALMQDNISHLPFTIALSKKTRRFINANIFIALSLKIFVLILAFSFGYDFVEGIGLMAAVIADTGTTVLVTLNAMRLLKFKNSYV